MFGARTFELLVLASFVVFGVIFWTKSPFYKKDESQKPKTEIIEESPDLGASPKGSIEGIKEFAQNSAKSTTQRVTTFVNDKKEEVASQLIGEEQSVEVKNLNLTEFENTTTPETRHFTVDLAKENNIILTIKKGEKIFLSFKNTKSNQCFYVNEKKYEITGSSVTQLKFNKSGNFQIQTNFCDLNFKDQGEVIVE